MKTYTHIIENQTVQALDHGVGVEGVVFRLERALDLDPAQPIRVGDFVTVEHEDQQRVVEINKIEHGPGGTTLKTILDSYWEYSRRYKEPLWAAHAEAKKFEAMGYRLEIDDPDGDLEILEHAA